MRKIRPLLFCLIIALCALGLGGCTRDNKDGSGESSTSSSATENNRETSNNKETQNNRETTSKREDNTESSSGVMEGIGDNVETMLDDAATMLDPNR